MNRLTYIILAVVLLFFLAGGAAWWVYQRSFTPFDASQSTTLEVIEGFEKFPVHINDPTEQPMVASGKIGLDGKPVDISCVVCHSSDDGNRAAGREDLVEDFHEGLHFRHGSLNCLSCHNSEDYDTLRLADSTALSFQKTRELCAQCHGPQHRDYLNGSHGGMVGYWDLSRGPRERNTCTDCHDPHAPAFPMMRPVFKPKDRIAPVVPPENGNH